MTTPPFVSRRGFFALSTAALAGLQTDSRAADTSPISTATLVGEMDNLELLARPARFPYRVAQASSYDRKSGPPALLNSGEKADPFANADAGHFLRRDTAEGRTEWVMADLAGPGAVMRIWSANPSGILRFYFDGETTPRFSAPMADLLTGKVAPFGEPFAYEASRGCNLYFPFPYARSLKITVEPDKPNGEQRLYYHVGYRTYASNAPVQTFDPADLPRIAQGYLAPVGQKLRWVQSTPSGPDYSTYTKSERAGTVAPGKPVSALLRATKTGGGAAVRQLRVHIPPTTPEVDALPWTDPRRLHHVLRRLVLSVTFDGVETVRVPLGDFFGSGVGLNPYHTLPMSVSSDGTLTCRFVMPFARTAQIRVESVRNGPPVPVRIETVCDYNFDARNADCFGAQWRIERGPTRPFRDMRVLTINNTPGRFVGMSLAIANPTSAWWGEGDEKVYVDGEPFPSTFGTGSEDYFGYAWSSPQTFMRPYHAQPRSDGTILGGGTFGHSSLVRWHVSDPIPFRRSLRFDMELWHWKNVTVTVARTAYFYAKPANTNAFRPPILEPGAKPNDLLFAPELLPARVPLAIEGETLAVAEKTGGTLTVQNWEDLSGGSQRWWTQPQTSDRLILRVPVQKAGRFRVVANFGHARDYGLFRLKINGVPVANGEAFNFYWNGNPEWRRYDLGVFDLSAGEVRLEIECAGRSPQAEPGNMLGLDYVLLEAAS